MRSRLRVGDAELGRWTMDRSPGEDIVGLAFEVRDRETLTSLTIARPTGEVERLRRHGIELPYNDGSFARVVCLSGLQLLPDRCRALREMSRVLVPGGEIEVAVRGSIERSPPFALLADSLERHCVRFAAAVRWLFCMPEPDDLRGVLAAADLEQIRVDVVRTTDRSPSITEFLASLGAETRVVPESWKGRCSPTSSVHRGRGWIGTAC